VKKRLFVLFLIAGAVFLWKSTQRKFPQPVHPSAPTETAPAPLAPPQELEGDLLLTQHGSPSTTPLEDIQSLQSLGTVFALLNRHLNSIHYANNEGLTKHLLGSKKTTALLSNDNPILGKNTRNQPILLDRWGGPYIIHLQSARKIEFRSPGPDKMPYTEDDITLAQGDSSIQ